MTQASLTPAPESFVKKAEHGGRLRRNGCLLKIEAKSSEKEVRTFVKIQLVIWDHLFSRSKLYFRFRAERLVAQGWGIFCYFLPCNGGVIVAFCTLLKLIPTNIPGWGSGVGVHFGLCISFFRCVPKRAHLRALITQKACAVGMRNTILRNHPQIQADDVNHPLHK